MAVKSAKHRLAHFERDTRHTKLLCVFGGRFQLISKVLDLNAEGLVEIFCTQEVLAGTPLDVIAGILGRTKPAIRTRAYILRLMPGRPDKR